MFVFFVMLTNITSICYVLEKLLQNKCCSVYFITNNSDMFLKYLFKKNISTSPDAWKLTVLFFQCISLCTVSGDLQEAEKQEH